MMATWSVLGLVASMISLAAGDGEAPAVGWATIVVRPAPGADLPPSLAEDVRAAVENALVGRTRPAVPIEITLDAYAVDVRVGSLARRVAVLRWDDVVMRTIALHVLDLMQPGPEVVAAEAPAEGVAAMAPAAEPSAPAAVWSLRAGAAGLRGAEHDNPWTVAFAGGPSWTRDWLRIGAELGWEHAPRHLVDLSTEVSYDAWPVRVAAAAQAGMLEGGIRAGVEAFRVTTEHSTWSVTPLAGAFIGIRLPATPWLHAVVVGGADVLPRRVQLTVGAATPYTTPRLAPYAGLVFEVGLNP
jgi:hypothetical protein